MKMVKKVNLKEELKMKELQTLLQKLPQKLLQIL
jgi:hypothetical protein